MFVHKSSRQVGFTLLTAALVLSACNIGAAPVPTVDVNAINTAAVATAMGQLSAQFTQTALAAPSALPTDTPASLPTFGLATTTGAVPTTSGALPTVSFNSTPVAAGTSLPGFTPLASPAPSGPTASLGDACNNSSFQGDISIPDGTVLKPGENFQKVWALKNTGTCKWDEGYSLVYIGGSTPDLDPYTFNFKKSSDFVASGETINIGINLTTPCKPGKYEGTWRMRNDQGFYFGTYLSVRVEVKDKC
jgi:Ig-like domain from next to BRCA1 gene